VALLQRDRRALDREVAIDAAAEDEHALLAGMQTLFTPSRHAIGREELERLERAFAALPDDYRSVIVLARVHGLSHAEIAGRLGRTEPATRTLLSRALARLALAIESA
jgi:RNA polymerase sigma-70 factor (ECF subfamily)